MKRWLPSLVAFVLLACGPVYNTHVPELSRPDTRKLNAILLDTIAFGQTKEHFWSQYPKEGAVCFYGTVSLAPETTDGTLVAKIIRAEPAISDSASEHHVWFSILSGCKDAPDLIAAGHSHTILSNTCSHSDPDAMVLFNDRRLLFTLVFCANGFTEVLYQDGRRDLARWVP